MKSVRYCSLLSLLSLAIAAQAADTAYTALRVVGKQQGQDVLNRVVELRGRAGTPQPAVWKVVLSDPAARGGVREVEVQRGKIIGSRSPTVRGSIGQTMDFSRLNLDSEGVFTVVNQEAGQQSIVFDRVDYTLRSGSGGGSPVWTAELFDGRNGKVASYQIAADSGTILGQNQARPPALDSPNDRDYVNTPVPPPNYDPRYPEGVAYDGHSRPGEPFRGVGDFFHRLGKRFERRGEKLENFFTGKRGH